MTTPSLVLALTIGAAAIAVWTYSRFDTFGPERIGAAVMHVCVSLALAYLVAPALMQPIVGNGESVPRSVVALFAVFLPALSYTFLSALWAFAGFARALPRR